jgi:hypothetical protein
VAQEFQMLAKSRLPPLLLWLAISCVAALSCALDLPACRIGGEYFPFGNDSFYHATRILETVRDPDAFYEFDPKIHAPEGSLLVWPWGYDYALAQLVRLVIATGLGSDPLMILLWMPVVAVAVGVAMTLAVAHQLGLGRWATALAGLCMALSPSTQLLYSVGQVDHHFAEHICILASLAAGLAWFRAPSAATGIALGVVLGGSLGIHNALFILQVPFLATAMVLWLNGQRPPARAVIAFGSALIGSALLVLIPSQPFQEGSFAFYLLSWFHLYVVCGTAVTMGLLTWLRPSWRSFAAILAIGVVLIGPLINQITYARSFVDGSLGMLDQILEMRSPLQMLRDGEIEEFTSFYTLLALFAPVTLVLCAVRLWRERTGPRLLFWLWCLCGLGLMTTQVRMHYFGAFALYLPWLVVVHEWAERSAEYRKRTLLLASLALVLAYAPIIRHELIAPAPHAADRWFFSLYPVFGPLREACAQDPGVVLADTNAGHYIRYFTDCSVIADNFLLTAQQFEKADEVSRLFSLPADQLIREAPFVKYVLTRAGDIKAKGGDKFDYAFFGRRPPGMVRSLLLEPATQAPEQFKLLYEVSVKLGGPNDSDKREVPYAKLFKVESAGAATSVSDVNE